MKSAFKSFALVTFLTLTCVFLAWNYVRIKGLSDPGKKPVDHPFFHQTFPMKIQVIADASPDELAKAAGHGPFWLEVHPLADSELVVGSSADPKFPKLENVLTALANDFLVLNFHENRPGLQEKIIAAVENAKAANRILVQSPEDGLLRDLREKQPMWIFGTSQAQTTRMKMLGSLGLVAAAPQKGDVYVEMWVDERARAQGTRDDVIEEAHRRKMKVIVGPVEVERSQDLYARGVDAVVVRTSTK